jgi:hypothetical protein
VVTLEFRAAFKPTLSLGPVAALRITAAGVFVIGDATARVRRVGSYWELDGRSYTAFDLSSPAYAWLAAADDAVVTSWGRVETARCVNGAFYGAGALRATLEGDPTCWMTADRHLAGAAIVLASAMPATRTAR